MTPSDLLRIASHLAGGGVGGDRGRPRQADLRRAVSCTYYALFHALARCGADLLVGSGASIRKSQAWRQTYRALDHGRAKRHCAEGRYKRVRQQFPQAIQVFADHFAKMQNQRHQADYDPLATFSRSEVQFWIRETKQVLAGFRKTGRRDQRAFAVFVLFNLRRN